MNKKRLMNLKTKNKGNYSTGQINKWRKQMIYFLTIHQKGEISL